MTEIEQWLTEHGLESLIEALNTHELDLNILLELTESDLKELGLALGARKRLTKAIQSTKQSMPPATSSASEQPIPDAPRLAVSRGGAQRRHLTVLFADLVGSTALSARIDPEDMQSVIQTYRDCVMEIIARHKGYVARFLGDGVLCLFGWPGAKEDDAERAIRAGLEVASAVAAIDGALIQPLQVRIGIASGTVVVGDHLGDGPAEEDAVYGTTPNLAARLQQLAEPGQVLVSETTRRLAGSLFEVEILGAFELKGLEGATPVYRVLRTRELESRFSARRSPELPRMIGRDAELAQLHERWRRAAGSEGRCQIIRGEAGIGKSRLAEALAADVAPDDRLTIRYQCSPHYAATPLYPLIRQMTRITGIAMSDSTEKKRAKLRKIVSAEHLNLFCRLLGIEASEQKNGVIQSARQLRLLTLRALIGEMVALSRSRPLLMLIEDAHWADATTLELLKMALGSIAQERILILVTARPEFHAEFHDARLLDEITLGRLASTDIHQIILQRLKGKHLPAELLNMVEARCDGIPLFIEEMVDSLMQSGEVTDNLTLSQTIKIPDTLQDSLMARIDRLNVAREIAQIASVIGREFSGSLLRRIIGIGEAPFAHAMCQLVRAEIVFEQKRTSDNYVFKHALVRDAAYSSLLKKRRRVLHAQILEILEADGATEQEVLAEHAAEAGQTEKAVDLWRTSSQLATARCAYHEAAHQIEAAIALMASASEAGTKERMLEMLGWLAFTWISAEGYMSERARSAARRATELAAEFPASHHRFIAYYANWTLRLATGPQDKARATIEAAVAETEGPGGTHHKFFANALAAYAGLCTGRLHEAEARLATAKRYFKPEYHNLGADRFGHICGPDLFYREGFLKMLQGRGEEASRLLDEAHASCPPGIDVHAETQLYMKTGLVALFMKDFGRLTAYANRLRAIADEYELLLAKVNADLYEAPLMIARGDMEGVQLFAAASEQYETQIMLYLSAARWVAHADLLWRGGLRAETKAACDHAGKLIEATGETLAEPELFRLRAETALADGDDQRAEAYFRRAQGLGHAQGANLWELRAAMGLAQFMAHKGEWRQAEDILRPVYDRCNQGGDGSDLREAADILQNL